MPTCTRILEFDAAHRVMRHESKCATLHGHRYKVEVTCSAPDLDPVGRVIDFGEVKATFGKWLDQHFDHTTLVNRADSVLRALVEQEHEVLGKRAPYIFDGEPTAENIAAELLKRAREQLGGSGLQVTKIRVWETPNCYAEAV